jgi:hypothetical protein
VGVDTTESGIQRGGFHQLYVSENPVEFGHPDEIISLSMPRTEIEEIHSMSLLHSVLYAHMRIS